MALCFRLFFFIDSMSFCMDNVAYWPTWNFSIRLDLLNNFLSLSKSFSAKGFYFTLSIYRMFFFSLCICLFLNSLSISSSVSESNIEFMWKERDGGRVLCDNWATSMKSINCMENGGQNATISDSGHGRVLLTNKKKQHRSFWFDTFNRCKNLICSAFDFVISFSFIFSFGTSNAPVVYCIFYTKITMFTQANPFDMY